MEKSLHKKGRPDSSSLNINENHGIQERMISCGILIDLWWGWEVGVIT